MKQEVLFIILNEYADWESAFVAASLHSGLMPGSEIKYIVKTVAPTLDAVCSLGGFRTLPDYSFDNLPSDYAALVLIGGMAVCRSRTCISHRAGCFRKRESDWRHL